MEQNKTLTFEKNDRVNFGFLNLPGTDMFRIEIKFLVGSTIEEDFRNIYGKNIFGGLHLLEHMSFKSTAHYSTEELLETLRKTGNRNANTNFDYISFFHTTISKHAIDAIKLITNVGFNTLSKVTDEEFKNEKDVVLNEIRRYNASDIAMYSLDKYGHIYTGNRECNLLGKVDVVDNITIRDLQLLKCMLLNNEVYVNFVYDSNKVNKNDLKETFLNLYKEVSSGEYYKGDSETVTYSFIPKLNLIPKGNFKLTSNIKTDQCYLTIINPVKDEDFYNGVIAREFIKNLSGKDSLFNKFREEYGLTYGASLYKQSHYNEIQTVTQFDVDIEIKNKDFAIKLYKEILCKMPDIYIKEKHEEVVNKLIINQKIDLNLNKYTNFDIQYFKYSEKLKNKISKDISVLDEVYKDSDLCSYEKTLNYMKELKENILNDNLYIVYNK